MLLPVERDHLKRLLALAASAPGFEDIVATYQVPEGTARGDGPYEPLVNETGVVRDIVFLNLGNIRVTTFDPSGNEPTPESPCVLARNFILEMFIDGKWMQSMTLQRIALPVFDYTSDDIVRVKAEFVAYAVGSSWVPAKKGGAA